MPDTNSFCSNSRSTQNDVDLDLLLGECQIRKAYSNKAKQILFHGFYDDDSCLGAFKLLFITLPLPSVSFFHSFLDAV